MLILAILFTLVLAAAFAVVPARLGRRKPTRADGCCALLPRRTCLALGRLHLVQAGADHRV